MSQLLSFSDVWLRHFESKRENDSNVGRKRIEDEDLLKKSLRIPFIAEVLRQNRVLASSRNIKVRMTFVDWNCSMPRYKKDIRHYRRSANEKQFQHFEYVPLISWHWLIWILPGPCCLDILSCGFPLKRMCFNRKLPGFFHLQVEKEDKRNRIFDHITSLLTEVQKMRFNVSLNR